MNKKMLSHLNDLDNSSTDIEASALVSADGLVMAATLPLNMDADHLGAICAGVFSLGHRSLEKCASGTLEQVLIKGAINHIVITHAGAETILAVIIKPYANLERIYSNLKQSIEKIAVII
jgi:uncharacterized protein